jgi:hypothetical protein
MKSVLILSALFALSQSALAGPGHQPAAMPKEFETLKKLVGTWEGKGKMHGDKEESLTLVYELTSGGTAITEKFMPGTPHEMISVYHKEGKGLAMTHYCSLGNHPMMVLKKADDTTMAFEMTKPVGVSSMKEMHMHALTLKMTDKDTLEEHWVNYENGKAKGNAVFSFKRKI